MASRSISIILLFGLTYFLSCHSINKANYVQTPQKPVLIMAQQFVDSTLPFYIKKNIAHIESMPFDGMFIHVPQSRRVMDGKPLSYDSIYNEVKILKGAFTKFNYNYLYIFIHYPGDFWDDTVWKITADNFGKMAKAAKAVGFKGIVYDNEEYQKRKWLNYGEVYKNPMYDFNQHRDQVMLRGEEVMKAMVIEFPELEVFNFHGPYISEPKTNWQDIIKEQASGFTQKELLGPFFVGMLKGTGKKARMIDAGEVYQYRTKEHFAKSYQWRKFGIASDTTDSWFIPAEIRKNWSRDVDLSFGLYNKTWKKNYPMSPEIMKSTLENAMLATDKYVWLWTEGDSWFTPGGISNEWIEAVSSVKNKNFVKNKNSPGFSILQ